MKIEEKQLDYILDALMAAGYFETSANTISSIKEQLECHSGVEIIK
jgi:hypothetical protein